MTTLAGRVVWPSYFVTDAGRPAASVLITVYARGKAPVELGGDGTGEVLASFTADDLGNTPLEADPGAPGDYDAVVDGALVPFTVVHDPADIAALAVSVDARAFAPLPTDHVVYVSKGVNANDANDGLTAYKAKATVQAAHDALPGIYSNSGGGRIVVLQGDHTGGLNITTPRTTVEFIAENARLSGAGMAPGSAVLRIARSRCRVIGGWVTNVPDNGVGVHVTVNETPNPPESTSSTSTQNTNIYGVLVDSLGANAVAYGFGLDTSRDVSETTLVGCSSVGNGSTSVHMQIGNGATGNVLDITNLGGNAQNHLYGLIINGGNIVSLGLNFQTSAGADIRWIASPVGPVSISGGRSENAFRFVDCTGVQFASPVKISDYHVTNLANTDGKGVKWESELPVRFEGVTLNGESVPQQFWVRQMQGSPSSAVASVVEFVNCWADHPHPFGPETERSGYNRTIIGGGQVVSSSYQPAVGRSANVQRNAVQRQTGASTFAFDAAVASSFVALLDCNCTGVSITNPKVGQVVTLEYQQDGVGGWTYVWPTNVGFAGNAAPAASSAARDSDSVTMRWTGSYWREVGRSVAVRPPTLVSFNVTDTFTGDDDWRPLPAPWEHLLGVFGRSGNKAAPVLLEQSLGDENQDQSKAVMVAENGRTTGVVQADVTYQAGEAGLVVLASDAKNFLYVWINASVVRVSAWVNGNESTVTSLARVHTAGSTYTLKVVLTTTGFEVFENGTSVITVADWSADTRFKQLKNNTKHGLYSSSTANRFDAFVANDGSITVGGFTAPDSGNLKTWVPVDQLPVVADGTAVSSAADFGGAGVPLTGSAPHLPAYKTAVLNGLPVLRFDGSDDFLAAVYGAPVSQPFTVILVAASSSTTNQYLFDGSSSSSAAIGRSGSVYYCYAAGAAGQPSAVTADTDFHLFVAQFNAGTAAKIWVDGGAAATGADIGTPVLAGITLGAGGGGAVPASCDVAELAVYVGDLSLVNLNTWITHLNTKYAKSWPAAT